MEWIVFILFIYCFCRVIKTGQHIPVASPLIGIFFMILGIALAPLIFPILLFIPLGIDFMLQEGDDERGEPQERIDYTPGQSPNNAFHYGRPTPRQKWQPR